ncbi:MAG TPA: carboxypeptidase-like regulatory domain-containing protein, partial [Nitrospira sp.]|nr:carboxypeptidase-like regulatory domain-containing protein [Nitrospira sp.]
MRLSTYAMTAAISVMTALLLTVTLQAQTVTTGQLAGTVTDQSGAAVANGSVQIKSLDNGSVTTAKTNGEGYYQFSLLKPGNYIVTASMPGFESASRQVSVSLG